MGNKKTLGDKTLGTRPAPGSGADADATTGSGRSGEGADSALEAMLRKGQTRVDSPPDPDAAKTSQQQQDGNAARE